MELPVKRSYLHISGTDFLECRDAEILGRLASSHHSDLNLDQKRAWEFQISHLRGVLEAHAKCEVFFEFVIPRMGKRVDVVLIINGRVIVVEYKVGSKEFSPEALRQVEGYALDLKNFHVGSHDAAVYPVLVATEASEGFLRPTPPTIADDGVASPLRASASELVPAIKLVIDLPLPAGTRPIEDAMEWSESTYRPTPTIVQAAQSLYRGHRVVEISRSEAGAENIAVTSAYVESVIERAKAQNRKAICFVSGVPGSGKTLAGLSVAQSRKGFEEEHAAFLSGNGPLVSVLREALSRDACEIAKENGEKLKKEVAQRRVSAFVQNVHHFRDAFVNFVVGGSFFGPTAKPPSEHVVVFDEAQRAWTREEAARFMKTKRKILDFAFSEPEFLLSAMDLHHDWCVVVCLIGDGQEINRGEAGAGEWLRAIDARFPNWDVYLPEQILASGDYVGGKSPRYGVLVVSDSLHLQTSIRSFRAEKVAEFIESVVAGDASRAKELSQSLSDYPILLTRNPEHARSWLRSKSRGLERTGLVASANAIRLKPIGLHVKASVKPELWFLNGPDDVRSSWALEDAATEFDVQGLELDWVGMFWDANMRWSRTGWQLKEFKGTRWNDVKDPSKRQYLVNSYRVLLTRARQGMVIVVPEGNASDSTRLPEFYDRTFEFLRDCGIPILVVT